tara:strand:+ start:1538 stop:2686 length:1149 start_codon:yes stop_codon:yes gene_type:complete
MKKKIFYWGPFLDNKIATVKAIKNSAFSINNYSKVFETYIIDAVGEWSNLGIKNNKNLNFISTKINIIEKLPKFSFLKSRLSYWIIFIRCFFPLKKIIEREKPEYIIIHLIVSLPLILFILFNFKTKLCLRISGFPKLNFFRKFLWKISSSKISKVMCPTNATVEYLKSKKIFKHDIFCLEDPVLEIRKVPKKKFDKTLDPKFAKNNIILIGRLTKQKNFGLFINAFAKIVKKYPNLKANILGDGELKNDLNKLINNLGLSKNVILLGHKENVLKYLFNSKIFILSSLWEDPGFVLIEAATLNKFIISSNCSNGPKEFLDSGKGGLIFESNSINSLIDKIETGLKLNQSYINKMILHSKKKTKKYSIHNHYKKIEKILKNEN